MRLRFKWIYTLLLAFLVQFSFAQEKTITGVVSENGMPLPGATVVIKGTAKGTSTDFDGKYSIAAKTGDVLEFSYVGMKTKSMTVGASNKMDVVLEGDNTLDEVIVVGYGTTSRERFTGTAAEIKTENIEAKTFSNVTQALRGEVAGVNVIQTSGQPGRNAVIRVRGFGSVNGNRAPLYVVDGVPFNGDISAINQADIESMNVLKDAAATSIYGSRGANGVILITTKTGKKEKSAITVDFRTSVSTFGLPFYDVIDSPEEYLELNWLGVKNKAILQGNANPGQFATNNLYGTTGTLIAPYYNIWNVPGNQLIDPATGKFNQGVARKFTPNSWADAAFRTGIRQEANIQFSGSKDKTNYSTSLSYLNDEGTAINSDFRRYTIRTNLDHKPKDWLKVGGNINFAATRTTNNGQGDEGGSGSSGNIFVMATRTPSLYDIFMRDANGNIVTESNFGGNRFDYGDNLPGFDNRRNFFATTNGIADSTYDISRSYGSTLFGNFYMDINLAKGLTFETKFGAQLDNSESNDRNNPFYGFGAPFYGRLAKTVDNNFNENFLQLLRYRTTIGKDDAHSIEAFVAHETTRNTFKRFSAVKNNVILMNTFDLDQYTQTVGKPSSFTQTSSLESYFSQLNYSFNQKYFLTASLRADGSSRFRNDKWGTFWSVGTGWVVNKEKFMSNVKFIDFLKLKASYGVIGDQGNNIRYGWQIFNIGTPDDFSFFPANTFLNQNLTWETSRISQVGLESSWFKNRLDINVDYYVKDTDNLFFLQTLPPSGGFSSKQINDGKVRNSGLEFDVNAKLINPKSEGGFYLALGINGEFLQNKVIEMPFDETINDRKIIDGNLAQGRSIFDHFMREWAGVDPNTGAGMWNAYFDDRNGNGIFDAGDVRILNMPIYQYNNPNANIAMETTTVYANATQKFVDKSSIPTMRGAFRLNFGFKNFDFSTQFSYSIGGWAYDTSYSILMHNDNIGKDNWHTDIRNSWKQPGDITDVPRLSDNYTATGVNDGQFNATSTRFLTKADYLSLNNARIGYTFNQKLLKNTGVSMLNIYVAGDNLMLLTHRDGFNPATSESGASALGRFNPITTYSFGAKIQF